MWKLIAEALLHRPVTMKGPEALQVVIGIVEGVDLQLAAIAAPGINLADGEAAAELLAGLEIQAQGERLGALHGHGAMQQGLRDQLPDRPRDPVPNRSR